MAFPRPGQRFISTGRFFMHSRRSPTGWKASAASFFRRQGRRRRAWKCISRRRPRQTSAKYPAGKYFSAIFPVVRTLRETACGTSWLKWNFFRRGRCFQFVIGGWIMTAVLATGGGHTGIAVINYRRQTLRWYAIFPGRVEGFRFLRDSDGLVSNSELTVPVLSLEERTRCVPWNVAIRLIILVVSQEMTLRARNFNCWRN